MSNRILTSEEFKFESKPIYDRNFLRRMLLGPGHVLRDPSKCAHERQKFARGKWFCTECGIQQGK